MDLSSWLEPSITPLGWLPLAMGKLTELTCLWELESLLWLGTLAPWYQHIGKLLAGKQRDNNNRADSQARKKCADISSSLTQFVIATETGREQQSCNYKQLCKNPCTWWSFRELFKCHVFCVVLTIFLNLLECQCYLFFIKVFNTPTQYTRAPYVLAKSAYIQNKQS